MGVVIPLMMPHPFLLLILVALYQGFQMRYITFLQYKEFLRKWAKRLTENHQPPRNRNVGVANYNWSHALFGVPNHHNILQTYIKIPKIIKIVHNNQFQQVLIMLQAKQIFYNPLKLNLISVQCLHQPLGQSCRHGGQP